MKNPQVPKVPMDPNSSIHQSESGSGNQTYEEKFIDFLRSCRGSRKLVLLIVAIALLLDNMLLTSVVPIIPAFLFELHHKANMVVLNETYRTSTHSPAEVYRERIKEYNRERPELLSKYSSSDDDLNLLDVQQMASEGIKVKCTCRETEAGKFVTEFSADEKFLTTPNPNFEPMYQNSDSRGRFGSGSRIMGPKNREEKEEREEEETTTVNPARRLRHEELKEENFEVGIMFASKPVVQAIINPFVGAATNRIGYSIPMFTGFIIMFLSTLIFAVGETFPTLLIARMLQGVGSACTSVAGMGMLADRYPDDRERGNAMAIALGGLALGVLIGPPFGGVLYEFVGKSAPFVILAFLALVDGLLQLLVLQPKVVKEDQEGATLLTLIKDPYILVAAGALTFANAGIAILEPSLPLWMMDTMNASNWEQGAAFLPASISYLIGTNVFGPLGHKMGRWLASMIGLIVIGLALLMIPLANTLDDLIIPNGAIGFAIGMVDSSMMPMLGYLVDIRHTSVYGSVYAIGDVAFCAGFVVGPMLSGSIGRYLGFEGLIISTAFICFAFAPFLLLLRHPPILNEEQVLLQGSGVKYVNYANDDMSPDGTTVATDSTVPRCVVNRALQPQASVTTAFTTPNVTNPFIGTSSSSFASSSDHYVH